jgi:hypothetical protein
MAEQITSFDPNIPQQDVDRLFRKLADSRLPQIPIVPDAGEDYGPSLSWIKKLYDYWLHEFKWEKAQAQISGWKHYMTEIEGLKVHFVHEKSKGGEKGMGRKMVPLLMVHGWPGTWFEFQNVMKPLLEGESEGEEGGEGLVFDLVVPSLPGYCWSQGPPRGHTLQDTARLFDTLMKRLGVQNPSSFLAYIR